MEKEKLWKSILGELEITISATYYNTFFPGTKIEEINNTENTTLIKCPSNTSKEIIGGKFKNRIQELITNRTGKNYNILFDFDKREENNNLEKPLFKNFNNVIIEKEKSNTENKVADNSKSGLVNDYTFENFIIGPNNRLAYTVAKAIADNPGKAYNPFLIYSGVGLGKTHLLQAIGNQIALKRPNLKVLYCTGQEFLNELMDHLQDRRNKGGTIRDFKNKFINNDVWLIDDVQVIAGREATQEEFFFAFNQLYLNKKQIVLSSDRHPSEIAKLQDRISSRFSMGMIADIQMPDVDIRTAILRSKKEQMHLYIDNETIDFIAENISTNIRELEGAFIQVITYANTLGVKANIETARLVLSNSIVTREEKNIRPTKVIQEISKFYGIEIREIKGTRRNKEIVLPRQVAMFLLKEINQLSLMSIGEILGGRDHTTIIHGADKIKKELDNGNFKLKKEISTIKENILDKY